MIDVDTFVLENGIEYTLVDQLVYNDSKYVLLSNVKDIKDSCIRKQVVENDEECLYRLDDEKEFETVIELFMEKNKALFS